MEWRVESIGLTGEVKIVFTSTLEEDRLNFEAIKTTGFDFRVIQNQEYAQQLKDSGKEVRDLSIASAELKTIGFNYMQFQVNFTKVEQVSSGGMNLEDQLFVAIDLPDLFFFKNVDVKVPPSTKVFQVKPRINRFFKGAQLAIPQQIDMSSKFNQILASSSTSAKTSLNTFILGTFVLNFVISFSMKKLLQSMRVLQLIAFMVYIQINFTPISKFFMQQLHSFVTFKVVPPELMQLMLTKIGINQQGTTDEASSEKSATRRL